MPSKFQIYVDQSIKVVAGVPASAPVQPPSHPAMAPVAAGPQPVPPPPPPDNHLQHHERPRFIPEAMNSNQRFYFDERKLYPINGDEYSFEEINYKSWARRQRQLYDRTRLIELQRENDELKQKIEYLNQQLILLQQQQQQQQHLQQQQHQLQQQQASAKFQGPSSPPTSNITAPTGRLSVVPQSLQPTQGLEYSTVGDLSCHYGAIGEATTVVQHCWRASGVPTSLMNQDYRAGGTATISDKFTVPIDQSQYIRDNVPTSTPDEKRQCQETSDKRNLHRRMSRPSMGGSPTLKLSPITETSRDCNSKSSSSSSAISSTPGTAKKALNYEALAENAAAMAMEEPDRPLDPNDPTTYRSLLRLLNESIENRSGYNRLNRSIPRMKPGTCFQAGPDNYLVDRELSIDAKIFSAQLLTEYDEDDSSSGDIPIKTVCFRVDQPANEWLFYICNELHRRLVKPELKPDIELSIMIANPAIMYSDGSILIDEYFRYVTLQHFVDACNHLGKPFPKSMAAYIALELIQLVRQMHLCNIVHMNICPKNLLITSCPTREDIESVNERTSIVKLIGFDRAMDTRLLPTDFKFNMPLADFEICQMKDGKPWLYEVDWYGVLNCICYMFFLEGMATVKNNNRWTANRQFKGFPTEIWLPLYDRLLNGDEDQTSNVQKAVDELHTWIKANISFVIKEADGLDRVLEEYLKATSANKSSMAN